MKLEVTSTKDVEDLVQWLNDHVAPGRLYTPWVTEANGQEMYMSDDHQSWQLVYFFMLGNTVKLIGLDKDAITELRLRFDFKGVE